MAQAAPTFHEMVELLSRSRLPLSVRVDSEFHPSPEEVSVARMAVSHVMTDADVRGRISSLKVEPLVRASGVLLETVRQGKGEEPDKQVAQAIIEYLDVLIKAFGNVPSALNNRGFARALAGDRARAHADYEAARRVAPAFIAPRVNELQLLREAGDPARMEHAAQEILKTDKANRAALRAVLDAKMTQRRPNAEVLAAAAALREAGAAQASDLLLLGSLCVQEGQPEKAVAAFRELIDKEPTSLEARQRAAAAALQAADYEGALGFYEDLLKVDGRKSEYFLAVALIRDQMDRPEEALQSFEEAMKTGADAEREIAAEALREFNQRRHLGSTQEPPEEPPPAPPLGKPLEDEEEMPGLDERMGEEPAEAALEPDFGGSAFEPKLIGELDAATLAPEELPVEEEEPPAHSSADAAGPPKEDEPAAAPQEAPGPEPTVEAAPAPVLPPEPATVAPPLQEEPPPEPVIPVAPAPEDLAQALNASISEVESSDDIMGVDGEPPIPAPPAKTEPAPEPAQPPAEVPEVREERKLLPVVSAPPPALPPPPEEGPAQPAEEQDPGLAHELEALTASDGDQASAAAEAEPFRRPTFDVDVFMNELERKTKHAFDTLYDGMLEARRKESAEGPAAREEPAGQYASGPALENLPSVPSAIPPPASPPPGPPMPLLLQEQAQEAARAPAAQGPRPPADEGLLARAAQLAADGDDRAAQSAVDLYLAAHPDDAHAWNLKGDLRERAGDEDQALSCYSNAVKYDPALKEAWNNLGVLLHLLGRFEESAQALEAGTQVDPHDRHLWHNLGSTYHELERLDDAIAAFDHAIEADPKDKVSLNNRGTTLFEKGKLESARDAFQRAIAIDPNFEQAQNNLGRAHERLNEPELAMGAYRLAAQLNPRSLTALRNLARVQRALGLSQEAAETQAKLEDLGG